MGEKVNFKFLLFFDCSYVDKFGLKLGYYD